MQATIEAGFSGYVSNIRASTKKALLIKKKSVAGNEHLWFSVCAQSNNTLPFMEFFFRPLIFVMNFLK